MYQLNEIDKLEIFVLVDNISDSFTENLHGIYWNESQYKYDIQQQEKMCGANYCRSCNGLSLLLKIHSKNKIHTLLFDTGPDADLAIENADRLSLNMKEVDAIVLSHGHFDHYGGTISALKKIGKKSLPVYSHPELFFPRAFGNEKLVYVSYNLTVEEVEKNGGKIVQSTQPLKILDDTILISGEVVRTSDYEQGLPNEYKLIDGIWHCSPNVIDERCLILNVKNKGLCVITGCGHTGVINAIRHAINLVHQEHVYFVMGGFHLAGHEFLTRIEPTIADLKKINPSYIITGHCTGRKTQSLLSEEFSERHIPYGVGGFFKFDSTS